MLSQCHQNAVHLLVPRIISERRLYTIRSFKYSERKENKSHLCSSGYIGSGETGPMRWHTCSSKQVQMNVTASKKVWKLLGSNVSPFQPRTAHNWSCRAAHCYLLPSFIHKHDVWNPPVHCTQSIWSFFFKMWSLSYSFHFISSQILPVLSKTFG